MLVVTVSPAWLFVVAVVGALALGCVGFWIGARKDMAGAGFLLGFFLGPVGLVVIAVMPPRQDQHDRAARRQGMRRCPHCCEFIRAEAGVCRFCRRDTIPVGRPVDENALDSQWESLYRS